MHQREKLVSARYVIAAGLVRALAAACGTETIATGSSSGAPSTDGGTVDGGSSGDAGQGGTRDAGSSGDAGQGGGGSDAGSAGGQDGGPPGPAKVTVTIAV